MNEQLLVDKDKVEQQRNKAQRLLNGIDLLEQSAGMMIKSVLESLDLWEDSSHNRNL